jgi:hypothetical protein
VFIMLLRNTDMMVLLRRILDHFLVNSTFLGNFCPDTTKTCLTAFNSSQLLDEKPFVRPFKASFGRAVLKLSLCISKSMLHSQMKKNAH